MRRLPSLLLLSGIIWLGPAATAQNVGPKIPAYWSVEGFINSQYSYSPGETNTFFIRHARVDLKGFVSDKLEFRLQTEMAGTPKMLDVKF